MPAKKILVVDDEKDVLTVLEKRLTIAGYFVLKADNGADAISLAKSRRPDLILLDIVMPNMDGGQVANMLKEDPQTKDIPIIFVTCLVRKEEAGDKELLVAGNYFIAKPYDPDELIREVKRHIVS